MLRALYQVYRALSCLLLWVQRRFTRAGITVLGALFVACIMGPDSDNNVAYQGIPLLVVLLLVAFCWSWSFRARFSATRCLPRFGTVGYPLTYTVRVRNLTRKPQAGLALMEELAEPRPAFQDWLAVQLADEKQARSFRIRSRRRTNPFKWARLLDLPLPTTLPNQEVSLQCELTPLRRGVLRLAGVILARPDPLGLFRAFTRVPLPQQVLVLPKRYPLPSIALPGTVKYQQGGVALASNVGQSEEFVSLRDYRQGDPLRHIHWRSWAKAGKPVVKEFEDEFFVRHALVLDTFAEHHHTDVFEEAVSVAASFACTMQTQESLLDLLFVGTESYCFTSGRGLAHADQMLEILASARACNQQPFQRLEHLVLDHVEVVSGCICVLLAWDQPRRDFVRKLKALGLPVLALVVVEPAERKKSARAAAEFDEPCHFLEVGKIEEGLAALA